VTDDPEDSLATFSATLREEWRREEEELTRAAHEQWQHGRSLAELAADWMAQGDTVNVSWGGFSFRGTVVEIGPDRVALQTGAGLVDIRLGARSFFSVEPTRGEGTTPVAGTSMRGKLLEYETSREPVTIHAPGIEARGRVSVAADHVLVDSGEVHRVIPLRSIEFVRAGD